MTIISEVVTAAIIKPTGGKLAFLVSVDQYSTGPHWEMNGKRYIQSMVKSRLPKNQSKIMNEPLMQDDIQLDLFATKGFVARNVVLEFKGIL